MKMLVSARAAILLLAAIMVCAQGTAAIADAVIDGHLYVVVGLRHGNEVRRYALRDGIPRSFSDASYHDGFYGPIALDGAGNLYAMIYPSYDQATVAVHERASKKLSRSIDLLSQQGPSDPYYSGPDYFSMAVDPSGFLYAAPTGSQSEFTPPAHCGWQIPVYAPDARGFPTPAQCLPQAQPAGMGFDSEGNLYLAAEIGVPDAVFVIANAGTAPMIIRTLRGPSFRNATATAVDDDGFLYVLMEDRSKDGPSSIAVYHANGNGFVEPVRTLHSGTVAWNGTLVVRGSRLYVTSGNQVLVFDKNASGTPSPLSTLTFPFGPTQYIAVGP
jgi:hypothetical protein